jgi:hypothetical protein
MCYGDPDHNTDGGYLNMIQYMYDEESERRWQEELYSQLKEDQRQRQMQMEEDWFREEAPFLEEELLRAEYEDLQRASNEG